MANLSAELVFRTVGRAVDGAGTFASGANAVARFLADEVGVPPASVQISDGSGLSLLDEATPRALVRLLAYEREAPDSAAFWQSLPVVGYGLQRRMEGTAAEGNLRAKTGTVPPFFSQINWKGQFDSFAARSIFCAVSLGSVLSPSLKMTQRRPGPGGSSRMRRTVSKWAPSFSMELTPSSPILFAGQI